MKAVTRRNVEIQLIYQHLRTNRRHDANYCVTFIKRNYFFDEDSQHIYTILGMDLTTDRAKYIATEEPSVIFQTVMNNEYQE